MNAPSDSPMPVSAQFVDNAEPDVSGTSLSQWPAALDLTERVGRALRAAGYGPLRRIEVTTHGGMVWLVGRVPSYHLKQIAQTATLGVPGVLEVQNDLEVAAG